MMANNEARLGVHILTQQPRTNYMVTDSFLVSFDNGYGASIIIGAVSFDRWELAVLHNGHICYQTPITSDVLRVNQFSDFEPLLDLIAQLPQTPTCNHERSYDAD